MYDGWSTNLDVHIDTTLLIQLRHDYLGSGSAEGQDIYKMGLFVLFVDMLFLSLHKIKCACNLIKGDRWLQSKEERAKGVLY